MLTYAKEFYKLFFSWQNKKWCRKCVTLLKKSCQKCVILRKKWCRKRVKVLKNPLKYDIFNMVIKMKRKIYQKLLEWKNSKEDIKPLIVLGARQVGKTYIIEEFCKNEYKNFATVNLFRRTDVVSLYKNNSLNSDEKYNMLKALIDIDLDEEDTILFIDEIQESEELISELKYFCEEHNSVRIICAGSLLGVKLKRSHISFPVGKVNMLNMYPMDFEEFMLAANKEKLIELVKNSFKNLKPLPESVHELLLQNYRYYLISGGMPESVQNFVKNDCDIIKYNSKIKDDIIESYIKDMKKYVTSNVETLKIEKLYKSIPHQIANESNKFQFTKIDENARSREYALPLDWLDASNLVYISNKVTTPEIPLEGYKEEDTFKLFINDIGLLNHLLKIKNSDIVTDNLSLFKGSIIENYVATQFSYNNIPLYYWNSNRSAEIDFLLYTSDGIIPVEVKAGNNTQSKSLKIYIEKYNPKYSIRISAKNFGYDKRTKIKSIPLYAAFLINDN